MAEAVTSLWFPAARPPFANGRAALSVPLAHPLHIPLQELRCPLSPVGKDQGHTPLEPQRGEGAPCPHPHHRTGRGTDCSTVCPVRHQRASFRSWRRAPLPTRRRSATRIVPCPTSTFPRTGCSPLSSSSRTEHASKRPPSPRTAWSASPPPSASISARSRRLCWFRLKA